MNVRIPKSSNKPDMKFIRQAIQEELDTARQDEREITVRRMVKLMSFILHENEGFGKIRCTRTAAGITDLINQGLEYWEGDVGDFWYKIDEELRHIGVDFYPSEDELVNKK